MTSFIFATTAQALPVLGFKIGTGKRRVLILGGVHGDEPEGVIAAYGLLKVLYNDPVAQLSITLVPEFNKDGVLASTRSNSRDVDLNRNLPTKDWTPQYTNERYKPGTSANSEPENQALVQFIEQNEPVWILSLHSWKPCLNINAGGLALAQIIQAKTGYEILEDIGYPTPGSLGTFAGAELQIPTLTYEIERGLKAPEILNVHVPAILAALNQVEKLANV